MSINSVLRALHGLQEALPDASIKGAAAYSDAVSLRKSQLDLLGRLPHLFSICPELDHLSISSAEETEPDAYEQVETVRSAYASFVFSVSVGTDAYKIEAESTDLSVISDEMEDIMDEVCGEDTESDLYRDLVATSARMTEVAQQFENHIKYHFEGDQNFLSLRNSFAIDRQMYERCLVDVVVDLDALRARMRLPERAVVDRLAISDTAPPHWNGVNLGSISKRLATGMDPHAADDNGVLPLVAASALPGWRVAVEALLDAGADVNAIDGHGFTALTAAVASGNDDVLPLLLERGANPDGTRMVPSLLVAIAGNVGGRRVQSLLDAGANPGAPTPSGKSFITCVEDYLDRANRGTRDEVQAIVRSLQTRDEVLNALDSSSIQAGQARSRSSGPSL